MFKYELDAVARNFCYNEYLEYLETVDSDAIPVEYKTYSHLCSAYDNQMSHELVSNNKE